MAEVRKCSGPTCDADVVWVRNVATGKRLILDALAIADGALKPGDVVVLGEKGKVLKGAHLDDGFLRSEVSASMKADATIHRTHWSSCADREHFAARRDAAKS